MKPLPRLDVREPKGPSWTRAAKTAAFERQLWEYNENNDATTVCCISFNVKMDLSMNCVEWREVVTSVFFLHVWQDLLKYGIEYTD